jgi:DNA-directed RNA polymerase subunit M/transcription elongation factor TFIIS
MKFCPTCRNLLYLSAEPTSLKRLCKNCGYSEDEEKGCLVVETLVQERSSEAYKILLNEFTRQDPTLPHVKTIKCPNGRCGSNGGGDERDVIYIKYDPVNLKYIYICNVCSETWRSRS